MSSICQFGVCVSHLCDVSANLFIRSPCRSRPCAIVFKVLDVISSGRGSLRGDFTAFPNSRLFDDIVKLVFVDLALGWGLRCGFVHLIFFARLDLAALYFKRKGIVVIPGNELVELMIARECRFPVWESCG